MKVLVLTTVLPIAPSGGGEIVTRAIIDALVAAGHDVEVIGYLRPDAPAPAGDRWRVAGRRPIETASAPRPTATGWLVRALVTRRGFSEAKYVSRSYALAIRAADEPDVVVVDHAQVAWAAERLRGPLVHVAHNVEYALYAAAARDAGSRVGAALHAREARRLGATERALASRAAEVWTLTAADAQAFAALGADTMALPFAMAPARPGAADGRGAGVALLGTWTWGPNRAGLAWFADHVLPLLPDGLDVTVAGRGAGELLAATRARAVGVVPDAAAFLAAADVVAVPSTAGAGLQVKTLDAIASGAAVVATPTALRGIDDPPPSVTVTADPAAFARALVERAGAAPDGEVGRRWAAARVERFAASVAEGISRVAARGAPRDPRA